MTEPQLGGTAPELEASASGPDESTQQHVAIAVADEPATTPTEMPIDLPEATPELTSAPEAEHSEPASIDADGRRDIGHDGR